MLKIQNLKKETKNLILNFIIHLKICILWHTIQTFLIVVYEITSK